MNNILLDTNILIYAFNETSIFHQKSKELILDEENDLFITTKNISEFFAVCSKLNLDLDKTLGFYSDLKKNCTILFPTDESLDSFETLINKYQPHGNRIYDIEIVSIMIVNSINKIATVNVDDFKNVTGVNVVEIKST